MALKFANNRRSVIRVESCNFWTARWRHIGTLDKQWQITKGRQFFSLMMDIQILHMLNKIVKENFCIGTSLSLEIFDPYFYDCRLDSSIYGSEK